MATGLPATNQGKDTKGALSTPLVLRQLGAILLRNKDKIFDDAVDGFNTSAMIKKALFEIRRNNQLQNCDPDTLFWCIREAAANGLEIGGLRSEAYIVPFENKATLIPGYKGLISLVRRSGELEDVTMETVHEGDEFDFEAGDNPRLRHVPSTAPDRMSRTITHVYCIFRLTGGRHVRNVWTATKVNAHRDQYSVSYQSAEKYIAECQKKGWTVNPKKLSAWHTAWPVMAYKTLIRDVVMRGRLPMSESPQVREIMMRDEPGHVSSVVSADRRAEAIAADKAEFDRLTESLVGDAPLAIENRHPVDEPKTTRQPNSGRKPQTAEKSQDYELDGTPVTKEAVPVTQEEQQVSLEIQLERATSLGAVTAIREHALDGEEDEDQRAYVIQACNEREAQIRESRSDK